MATKKDKLVKELIELTTAMSKRKLDNKQIEGIKYSIEKRLVLKGRKGYIFLTNVTNVTNKDVEMPIRLEMPTKTRKDREMIAKRLLQINHLI